MNFVNMKSGYKGLDLLQKEQILYSGLRIIGRGGCMDQLWQAGNALESAQMGSQYKLSLFSAGEIGRMPR